MITVVVSVQDEQNVVILKISILAFSLELFPHDKQYQLAISAKLMGLCIKFNLTIYIKIYKRKRCISSVLIWNTSVPRISIVK